MIGVSKQDIREQIWDYMESQNIADFPRPVHHRIPNFKAFKMARTIKVNPDAPQKNARFFVLDGSYLACQNIKDLEVFARTQEVKVDPDKPLEGVRLLSLQSKKTLLVPTPRLRTGLFNRITPPPGATKDMLRKCATSQGVRDYSVPVGLDARVLVDLVVVGSVAVSEKGWRIGKGEGYADLEYAMMASMGAVSQGTPVVTIVHDCQVVDIPEALLEDHDLTVDIYSYSNQSHRHGISCAMMGRIPILRSLRSREKQAGRDVTLKDEHPHLEARSQHAAPPGAVPRRGGVPSDTVYVGNLPRDTRVRELERALRTGRSPTAAHLAGPPAQGLPPFPGPSLGPAGPLCLQGLHLGANTLKVALARQQRASDPAGGPAREPHLDH
ncbi:hypothetical protein QTO34_010565 [Cnephaeus nilssonii]|uniref:Methenyltetrahydrofolate synthase domain-containing protein n=1 Tax=Cnephaeus nilssonii TaxID=3371016 RepID=A0AA40LEE1_CNENI|nr:hypothetical protein QTO34_010565 [Eptesicus nilssonii]